MNELVVTSERVVLPDAVRAAAVHIRDGRIVRIADYGDTPAGVRRLDARESVVLPGLVDAHVHMNDPGRDHWEGVEHATRAAAAGGVTTVVDMPLNSLPPTTTVAGLAAKRAAIEGRCHVDVGFWGGVVPGNADALAPLRAAGVLGFKCFLCPSGVDEFEHVTEKDLREAMPTLARLGVPLLAHAESPDAVREMDRSDGRRYRAWLESRPPRAEVAAIELLIRLAEEYGARVHVVHLSSADAVAPLRDARLRGVAISAETCPHYLTFAAEEVPDGATAFKCAPPIREGLHRDALWRGLADGDIDMIATDHSPAPSRLKCVEEGDLGRAWGGIASLQLGLAAVWAGAARRDVPVERLARWMAEAPARLAGLDGHKGTLAAGADADLVVWDPDAAAVVDPATLHHRHPVTPYAGMTLRGRVRTTLLRGEVVCMEGHVSPQPVGRLLGTAS